MGYGGLPSLLNLYYYRLFSENVKEDILYPSFLGAFKIGGDQKEMVESGWSQQASTFQQFSSLLTEMHYLNSTILPIFATQNLSHPLFSKRQRNYYQRQGYRQGVEGFSGLLR